MVQEVLIEEIEEEEDLEVIEVVLEEVVIEGIEEAITIKPNRFQKIIKSISLYFINYKNIS